MYTIFVDVYSVKERHEIYLRDDATVEEAIIKTINLDDPKLGKVSIEDLEFYLSSKKGKVKDDLPHIDKT